jgi:hypothetical protein
MSLGFDMTGWSAQTKASAERLEQWPIETVSGFIVHAAKRENEVMARFRQAFAQYEEELLAMPGIRTNRLAKTHGQLLPSSMRCARCSRSPTSSRPPRPSSSSTWRPSGNWP